MERTAGTSPKANRLPDRHCLTLLDMALPMLTNSNHCQLGLSPLGQEDSGDVVLCANQIHKATPAMSALVGWTPNANLQMQTCRCKLLASLLVVRRIGCRVWVPSQGRPHTGTGSKGFGCQAAFSD
jgi:hypothetical protein